MARWQLQEAKNKLSEVVQQAQRAGPQSITVHGREAAVVISADEYRSLVRRGSLASFLRGSPLASSELEIDRSREPGRDVEL